MRPTATVLPQGFIFGFFFFFFFVVVLIIKYLLYNTGRKIKLGNASVGVTHAILNHLPHFTMKALMT